MNPTSQPTPMTPGITPASTQQPGPAKPRGTKRLLAVVVMAVTLVTLVVVGWWWLNQNTSPTEAATVIIRDSVFEPATLQVKKGQDVTWTNDGQASHHIYADQSVVPGLDSQEPLGNGDTYSFTFDNPGTYHYYDSLNPKLNATVVVQE